MEYTQEQIDQLLEEARTEVKKGLLTQEEFNAKLQAETDRRVNSAIESKKAQWEADFKKKAEMSADELAQQKLQDQLSQISVKEKEIAKKANLLQAKEILAEANIPKTQYERLLSTLISDDSELTTANVQSFIEVYNDTKTEIETRIKSELSNVKPPATGGSVTVTKEDFNKMGYNDKIKFKGEFPDLYKQFIE